MWKQLISFANVVNVCKISSSRGGLTPSPPCVRPWPQSYLSISFTLALGFQTEVLASNSLYESNTFSKLFLLKWIFLWLQMSSKLLNNGDFYKTHATNWLVLIHSIAVQTDNLSSKLLTKTHKPASRTSFSDSITSCRKTAVVLKLSKVIFAEFFTLTAKMWCW